VTLEGLTCILLRLSLSDRGFVEMVLNLIKSSDLNCGATELEKRGVVISFATVHPNQLQFLILRFCRSP
jgi:hypothetical protein